MYKKLFNMTFNSIFKNIDSIFYGLFPHFFFILLITLIFQAYSITVFIADNYIHYFSSFIIYWCSIYVVIGSAMLRIYKIIILNEKYTLSLKILKFTFQDILFFFKLFIFVALIGFPIFSLFFFYYFFEELYIFVNIFIVLISSIFLSRFILVLPYFAVNKKITFLKSWKITQDYKLLVYFQAVAMPGIFSILVAFFYINFIDYFKEIFPAIRIFLDSLHFFISIIFTSAIAILYKHLLEIQKVPLITIDKEQKVKKNSIYSFYSHKDNSLHFFPTLVSFLFILIFSIYMIHINNYKILENQKKIKNSNTPHQILKAIDKFLALKNYKSFSIAYDKNGQYSYGFSYGHNSQKNADKKSLQMCNKYKNKFGINKECTVYIKNEHIQPLYGHILYQIKKVPNGCDMGNAEVCFRLATKINLSNKNNKNTYLNLLEKSCNLKYAKGCFFLAKFYFEKKKVNKVIRYYKKAYTYGYNFAYTELGLMYKNGLLVKKNNSIANRYFLAACKKGESEVACKMINTIIIPVKNVKTLDIDNLITSCDNGRTIKSEDCAKVGDFYIKSKNFKKAIFYFEKICSKLESAGCLPLGLIYSNNSSGFYNISKSIEYLRKGCLSGNATSCYEVAKLFEETNSKTRSMFYFSQACSLGIKKACEK